MENNRASFGSNFGFIMAAVGSAVGLGNIWGFPYKMGMSGLSPVAAYRKLSKKFTWMGYMAVLVPFLVLCFYFVLGGMVTRYALGYLTAIFGWNTWGVADIADFFGVFEPTAAIMKPKLEPNDARVFSISFSPFFFAP